MPGACYEFGNVVTLEMGREIILSHCLFGSCHLNLLLIHFCLSFVDSHRPFLCVDPITDSNLGDAINLWLSDQTAAIEQYLEISMWDISRVTSLSRGQVLVGRVIRWVQVTALVKKGGLWEGYRDGGVWGVLCEGG